MKWSYLKIFSVGIILLLSCSKEVREPEESISDYSQIEIGNYWIYDCYLITPDRLESFLVTDTLIIEKDSIIAGRIFFIKSGTILGQYARTILFDSAKALYTYPARDLVFTIDLDMQYQKIFGLESEPLAIGNYRLKSEVEQVEVPAGIFSSLKFSGTIESTDENYEYGTRYHHTFFTKNVGMIKMTSPFILSPDNLEMRLVKFGEK